MATKPSHGSGHGPASEPQAHESVSEQIIVRSGSPLEGSVRVAGAKNSALKLMAATLLAEGAYRLSNMPRIVDVDLMAELLRAVGCSVERDPKDTSALRIDVPARITPVAPYDIVERFRASVVLLGPMLARCGEATVALPGGDDFGPRPVDMHVKGLAELGARVDVVHGNIEASAPQLLGARVVLEFPSVGATENLLMAAVAAKGRTVIDNAAREPEILDLCRFLQGMGARVSGVGASTLVIDGSGTTELLQSTDHAVVPDRIVAATYLAALGVASGEILVEGARYDHMELLCAKLTEMGMILIGEPEGIRAVAPRRLDSVDCSTLPYPGIATDCKPFLVTMLATASGVGIVTENLFPGRFRYVDELRRMGADIRTDAHHAVVRGVDRLSGAPVRAHDIRAGAALAVAGLGAEGPTVISDAHHVRRGYENLVGDLASLGADIRIGQADSDRPGE